MSATPPSQPDPSRRPIPASHLYTGPGTAKASRPRAGKSAPFNLPPIEPQTTTLWTYPSQHYWSQTLGRLVGVAGVRYTGATPSWVIWQCLVRYTSQGDTVLDPMVGSGTTLEVCEDLGRKAIGFDLNPQRQDIRKNDARTLPLPDNSVDFVFIDPPYSTHVVYSNQPECIGTLDTGGPDGGRAYYTAMASVLRQISRVLRPGRFMALYVSDSYVKSLGPHGFMPIGFELFNIMRTPLAQGGAGLTPVDIISVVRGNQKLTRPDWHAAADQGNFFLRGFNYLFIMRKDSGR